VPVTHQLSLFGVEASPPDAGDLEGLLAGAGQVVRLGGTARVSIVVDAAWRVRVLIAECELRGLTATWEEATVEGHFGVRTAYSTALAPLAVAWLRGAVKRPPADFGLDGRRLRLWLAAAGSPDGPGAFSLGLGASDERCWEPVGAALAAVGVPAVLLGPRAGGPAYRILGRRRLTRLAELVGEAPEEAPDGAWPAFDVSTRPRRVGGVGGGGSVSRPRAPESGIGTAAGSGGPAAGGGAGSGGTAAGGGSVAGSAAGGGRRTSAADESADEDKAALFDL
jgi:hypothetical protein